jgi:predicted phosphodiesterase
MIRESVIIDLIKLFGSKQSYSRESYGRLTERKYLRHITKEEFEEAKRRVRENGYKSITDSERVREELAQNATLRKILDQYTQKELQAIAEGGRILPGIDKVPIISFEGKRIRFGAISDTHIGHQMFDEARLFQAFEEFKKEGVEFITHSGDVTEGMSHRPGHVYELDAIGYDAQKEKAVRVFSQWQDTPIYAIDGNHDRWYIKSNGAYIVKDIDRILPNFHFIGHDEGDISLDGKATIKLWHGEDGNSYALSYRIQKIIESLSGGEKPSLMLCGHTHKYVKLFERNIHAISVGSIEAQTKWMRGKRIAAATGFCIIDAYIGVKGITKLTETWYPYHV